MTKRIKETFLNGGCVIETDVFSDHRGYFMEVYRSDKYKTLGLPESFQQVNQSHSKKGTIRGLHFQWDPPMGKLMRVTVGEAFLVAVDIRNGSPTQGKWFGTIASADNKLQVWAPAGFARGFCVLSDTADVEYFCTGSYNPQTESGIKWDDARIGITWPIKNPILSDKDKHAQSFEQWLSRKESSRFAYA